MSKDRLSRLGILGTIASFSIGLISQTGAGGSGTSVSGGSTNTGLGGSSEQSGGMVGGPVGGRTGTGSTTSQAFPVPGTTSSGPGANPDFSNNQFGTTNDQTSNSTSDSFDRDRRQQSGIAGRQFDTSQGTIVGPSSGSPTGSTTGSTTGTTIGTPNSSTNSSTSSGSGGR